MLKIVWKLFWQLMLVPVFVCAWLISAGAIGVHLSFENGSEIRLRGWWRE